MASNKPRNAYTARRAAEMVEAGKRAAQQYDCPKCGTQCLRGDDGDNCSLTATVDIEPIDHLAEALAINDGIFTYDISPAVRKDDKRGAFLLYHRDAYHYLKEARKHPVLRDHHCRKAGQ